MICQVCGFGNPDEVEFCGRCQARLLIISGASQSFEEGQSSGAELALDESVLERVSLLEEVAKRSAETLKNVLEALHRQEKNAFVVHTSTLALRDILERKGVFLEEELLDLWESRVDIHMGGLEKRERFLERRERILEGFKGERLERFRALLAEAEFAFYALDPEKAVQVLEEAWKLDRSNIELAFFLGEAYFNESHLDRAQSLFKQVLTRDPHHFEALVYMGVLENALGHSAKAAQLLQTATGVKPDEFLPYFALGAILAASGHFTKAEAHLKKAIEIEQSPRALALLGTILFERGRTAEAIEALQEAIRMAPDDEDAIFLLGVAYLDRGWTNKAAERFHAALELRPNRVDFKEGAKLLARSSAPGWPKVEGDAAKWTRRAEDIACQDPEQAAAFFRKALTVDPENPSILIPYSLLCSASGRTAEAVAMARHVLSSRQSEKVLSAAYALLLESLRAEGKFREEQRVADEMLTMVKTRHARAIGYFQKAAALAEIGEDLDKALAFADQSLGIAPAVIQQFSLAVKGWVHYKRKEFDEAVRCLRRSAEMGENPPDLTHLGLAYLAIGDTKSARETFERVRKKGGIRLDTRGGLETRVLALVRRSLERPREHRRSKS